MASEWTLASVARLATSPAYRPSFFSSSATRPSLCATSPALPRRPSSSYSDRRRSTSSTRTSGRVGSRLRLDVYDGSELEGVANDAGREVQLRLAGLVGEYGTSGSDLSSSSAFRCFLDCDLLAVCAALRSMRRYDGPREE